MFHSSDVALPAWRISLCAPLRTDREVLLVVDQGPQCPPRTPRGRTDGVHRTDAAGGCPVTPGFGRLPSVEARRAPSARGGTKSEPGWHRSSIASSPRSLSPCRKEIRKQDLQAVASRR